MADTPAQTLALGITTDVGSVANALAAIFKFADTLTLALNTPEMVAARKREDVQKILAQMDHDLKAAQAGDADARAKIDAEVSG